MDDPYTIHTGNPLLGPEFRSNFLIEHTLNFGSNYFSSGLFFNRSTSVINNLTILNDTNAFLTKPCNLGTLDQYGIQFSGSIRMGIATFNPYLKIFGLHSIANDLAQQYAVSNRRQVAFESSFSTVLSFRHDVALSVIFQYASPKNNIQDNSFCDALYFLSVEKTFKNIKIGIKSGLPFTKSFTYQGSDSEGANFYSHYEGNLEISSIPVWIKMSYQFQSGKNRERIHRAKEEIDNVQKKGF